MEKTDLLGQVIRHYKIKSFLAEGGMVWVFRAIFHEKEVVIKIIRPDIEEKEHALTRFRYTVSLQKKLNHPHVVKIYDYFQDEIAGQVHDFLVEEYVDGETLDKRIKQKKNISPLTAIYICKQILQGLHHAHLHEIVHRDVKPNNVLITPGNMAKITDFGIAKEWTHQRNLTQANFILGTIQYMAPEQIAEPKKIDHRTDIYATGVMLYQLLTSHLPYGKSLSQYQWIEAHLKQTPYPFDHWSIKVHPALEGIVFKSLQKDRENRFKTALEFAEALEQIESNIKKENQAKKKQSKMLNETLTPATLTARLKNEKYPDLFPPNVLIVMGVIFVLLLGILGILILLGN